jgi:phage baseplate assembly protein W
MPVSRAFRDINITFGKHPVTDDLLIVKDFNAIKNSVMSLLLTVPGERFFNPNIGSRVYSLLFEPMDFITRNSIKSEIEYTIRAFEPRVLLENVLVNENYDNNTYDIEIEYTIVGLPEKLDTIQLTLERTRA